MPRPPLATAPSGALLAGSALLAIASNALFQLSARWLGAGPSVWPGIVGGSVASLIVVAAWASAARRRRRVPSDVDALQAAPNPVESPCRGLIFLVGKREVFEEAIRPHDSALERLWLICSAETQYLARELADEQRRVGRTADPRVVGNVHDPMEFYGAIREILAHLPEGWGPADIISDYVGMTSHASVGMVLACLNARSRLQFTRAEYDQDHRALHPLPPFEVVLDLSRPPKEIPASPKFARPELRSDNRPAPPGR